MPEGTILAYEIRPGPCVGRQSWVSTETSGRQRASRESQYVTWYKHFVIFGPRSSGG